jgi:hypothetical protein
MVALKVDLYQPKYANMPITYTVTPCPPGTGILDKHGVGTVFNGFNAMGMPENLTITECHYESSFGKVVFETKGILVTYTTTALPNGDCQFTVAMDGPSMGLFQNHMAMQVNTMKAFIEANTTAICADAPPAGRAVVTAAVVIAPAVPAAGVSDDPLDKIMKLKNLLDNGTITQMDFDQKKSELLNLVTGSAGAGAAPIPVAGVVVSGSAGGFVEVPQHAQAQQAASNMLAQSQTEAIMRSNRANHSNHHNY